MPAPDEPSPDDIIESLVRQSCYSELDAEGRQNYDSSAISTYADAMRYLEERGRFTITKQYNRRVIGYFEP